MESNTSQQPAIESAAGDGVHARIRDERRRAVVALLRRPLLTSQDNGDDFTLVRRHATWLKEWFARHCNWILRVEAELARLRKTPGDLGDSTRSLLDSKEQPFSRRRYALLCLALAVLEKSDRQTVLGRLAEEIGAEFVSDPQMAAAGASFDLAEYRDRRDLVEVVKYLINLHVLTRIDGDEARFLVSGQNDVLYNINRNALAAMLNVGRGPSTIQAKTMDERIGAAVNEPFPDTEDGRHRRLRTRLFRRLLDDPIVYYARLDEDERAYLVSQRHSISKEIEESTGLTRETRLEGLAMVDPDDAMTDVRMPEEGTDGHATLLLSEYLAKRLRDGTTEPAPMATLERHMQSLIRLHSHHWRKDASESGAAAVLLRDAISRMEMLRLIDVDHHDMTVTPLPAIGRFAVGEPRQKSTAGGGRAGNGTK